MNSSSFLPAISGEAISTGGQKSKVPSGHNDGSPFSSMLPQDGNGAGPHPVADGAAQPGFNNVAIQANGLPPMPADAAQSAELQAAMMPPPLQGLASDQRPAMAQPPLPLNQAEALPANMEKRAAELSEAETLAMMMSIPGIVAQQQTPPMAPIPAPPTMSAAGTQAPITPAVTGATDQKPAPAPLAGSQSFNQLAGGQGQSGDLLSPANNVNVATAGAPPGTAASTPASVPPMAAATMAQPNAGQSPYAGQSIEAVMPQVTASPQLATASAATVAASAATLSAEASQPMTMQSAAQQLNMAAATTAAQAEAMPTPVQANSNLNPIAQPLAPMSPVNPEAPLTDAPVNAANSLPESLQSAKFETLGGHQSNMMSSGSLAGAGNGTIPVPEMAINGAATSTMTVTTDMSLASSTATRANTAPQVPVNQLAVHIASQAQAQAGNQRFDIRLDPPELGRIDIRLEINSDGQTLTHLAVEKAETLDILQRDQRALERALQQAGLNSRDGSMSFSLREDGQGSDQHAGNDGKANSGSNTSSGNDDAAEQHIETQTLQVTTGLDISI